MAGALLSGCAAKKNSHASKEVHIIAKELTSPTMVEAACGRCLFGHKEDKKCNLAIRVDGKSYFVDGFTMSQFGNPDLSGGMCKKIHSAQVSGKIVNDRFAATSFELLPLASR